MDGLYPKTTWYNYRYHMGIVVDSLPHVITLMLEQLPPVRR
jgi:hypothetical protein